MRVQWNRVVGKRGNTMTEKKRYAKVERTTNETQISVAIDLDGEGKANIKTGVGFMDHMLDLFIKHGLLMGR